MRAMNFLLALGTFSLSYATSVYWVQAQQSDNEIKVEMTSLTCEDLLRSSGEDRENLVILMHGFMLGKTGNTTIDSLSLGEATDKITDSCISDTSQSLMKTFEEAHQSGS